MNLLQHALTRRRALTDADFGIQPGYQAAFVNSGRPINGEFEVATTNLDEITERIFKRSGPIFSLIAVRMLHFAEARLQWQQLRGGRPGDLFGTTALALLENPWPSGTTGDLLGRMLLDVDLMGNAFVVRQPDRLRRLRPDWVFSVWGSDSDPDLYGDAIDGELLAYVYLPRQSGGFGIAEGGGIPERHILMPDEVAHFAPYPDPQGFHRGMSWLTPMIREIEADNEALIHKQSLFRNGAVPRLAMRVDPSVSKESFERLVEAMEAKHAGPWNAYRTLYVGGGADPVPLTFNLKDLDYHSVTGLGETRMAAAAGVPPVIVGFTEGLKGSALNAGNYQQSRRRLADGTLRPLWRNLAGSLQTIFPAPNGARLWYDDRDIAFLRDDANEAAAIDSKRATTIRTLIDAGFYPDAAIKAGNSGDFAQLAGQHSGLFSVQLQPPGNGHEPNAAPTRPPKAPDDPQEAP